MKPILGTAALGLVALAIAGCETTPSAPLSAIETEDQFRALLADKTLVDKRGNEIIVTGDGRFGGDIGGAVPNGEWRWENGRFCRELTVGENAFPFECQVVETNGETFVFNRSDGSTSRWRYK